MTDTLVKILDSAERDVRSKGFHAVSFRDIAAELGIKSASVHYHFPKKEDLGLALIARYSDRVFDALESKSDKTHTPKEHIDAMVDVYRSALAESDRICLCGMLGAESAGLPATMADAVAEFFNKNVDWLVERLPEQVAIEERKARASNIVSTLQGSMMMANSLGDHSFFDQAVSQISAG
ncbi:MAG: TetR/AcrR family transcriptional regulator [Rhizobiaceae bacterium]|nr:TetR/AcrR family transcriptional regulator [Rhizobiaceae bacterium]